MHTVTVSPLSFVAIHCYSGLLECARTLVGPFLTRSARAAEWDIDKRQRIPIARKCLNGESAVWLHAASLGETQLMFRFLDVLRAKYPHDKYVLTATTRGGLESIERRCADDIVATGLLPFDTIPLMKRVIEEYGVTRLWLMETELWPSLLWVCLRRNIPVGIVNARLEERSFARYRRWRRFLAPLFARIDTVFAQTAEYAGRYEALGVAPERLHITGNLKSCVTVKRPSRDEWLSLRDALNIGENDIVLTAGCLHPTEGAVIRRTLHVLRESAYPVKCIVVPRHLNKAATLCDELGPGTLHLREFRADRSWAVCLIEQFGILDNAYKVADAAVIGGTFTDVGGHNIWDAARYGIPVFFGPDCHTQQESRDRVLAAGVGFLADTAEALADRIIRVLRTDAAAFIATQTAFAGASCQAQESIRGLLP